MENFRILMLLLKSLFDICVAFILDYGSKPCDFKEVSKIDTVQNRALAFYLGGNKFTPSNAVQEDFRVTSSKDGRSIEIVNYLKNGFTCSCYL